MDANAIRTLLVIVIAVVSFTIVHDLMRDLDASRSANVMLMNYLPHNAYARYLGEEVLAKVYEASEWKRCVIVAVSWHGSVCVRHADDLATKGRWIHHAFERGRVKPIGEQHE